MSRGTGCNPLFTTTRAHEKGSVPQAPPSKTSYFALARTLNVDPLKPYRSRRRVERLSEITVVFVCSSSLRRMSRQCMPSPTLRMQLFSHRSNTILYYCVWLREPITISTRYYNTSCNQEALGSPLNLHLSLNPVVACQCQW